jgi:GTPase Era involved in 16S rRNA processing
MDGLVMGTLIRIAVIGHTNAGKTSLLRTLTRRRGFGEVSDRPGTTRHVESIDLQIGDTLTLQFLDTPGLEDPVELLESLGRRPPQLTPPAWIRAFLQTADAADRFEQEAKVLRSLLDVEAALFVIDCREPVVAKFRSEVELLASCGKPVLPVLNFVVEGARREAAWLALLSDYSLHAVARFDAVAPYAGAERRLYNSLQTILASREDELQEVAEYLESERLARQEASWLVIAETLVDVCASRLTLERAEWEDPARKAQRMVSFREAVLARARRGVQELLSVHAFSPEEADIGMLPWLDGRWESDVFDPETLRDAAKRLGTGAAVGAALGLVADVALAGVSLGAGLATGAALGGAASQGFGVLARRLTNLVQGRVDLSAEDAVVLVLADRLVALVGALETRGHAASRRVELGPDVPRPDRLRAILAPLRPARAHPEWVGATMSARTTTVEAVSHALRTIQADEAAPAKRE